MNAQTAVKPVPPEHIAPLLHEIANEALSLRDLFTDISCSQQDIRPQSLAVFASVAEKIGALADLANKRLTGHYMVLGSMEDWMLSPAARGDDDQASEDAEGV